MSNTTLLIGAAAATLLLPIGASVWLRSAAKSSVAGQNAARWVGHVRWMTPIMILAVPIWWGLLLLLHDSINDNSFGSALFWILLVFPLSGSAMAARFIIYSTDAAVFGKKWSVWDVVRLAFWKTVSSTFALLVVAAGVEQISGKEIVGFLWMFAAAIISLFASLELRKAQGLTPRPIKSGELYKRSMVVSRKMGVRLKQVCVVPFGRGHLTNAYGGIGRIAVTDDYGHWLFGAELDFVIGHELAHVKGRDAVRKLAVLAGLFLALAASLLLAPLPSVSWRIACNFVAILLPLMIFYTLSRRGEYSADRLSISATGEPEAAIRALTNLYRRADVPARCNGFLELFSTHPSLSSRIDAIARYGGVSVADFADPTNERHVSGGC